MTDRDIQARSSFVSFEVVDKHCLQSILEANQSIISFISLRPYNILVVDVIWGSLLVTRMQDPLGLGRVGRRHDRRGANGGEPRVAKDGSGAREP